MSQIVTEISDKSTTDAYTYLLSRYLVLTQEHMDRAADGFAHNPILYNPLGSADFVNPNLDGHAGSCRSVRGDHRG